MITNNKIYKRIMYSVDRIVQDALYESEQKQWHPIRTKSDYSKPHVYKSVFTFWNSLARASYKLKLRYLMQLDKMGDWYPEEQQFISCKIYDIIHNHMSCLPDMHIPAKYLNMDEPDGYVEPVKKQRGRQVIKQTPTTQAVPANIRRDISPMPKQFKNMSDDDKSEYTDELGDMFHDLNLELHDHWDDDRFLDKGLRCLNDIWERLVWMYGDDPDDENASELVVDVENTIRTIRRRLYSLANK